jgi:hypothetical protein
MSGGREPGANGAGRATEQPAIFIAPTGCRTSSSRPFRPEIDAASSSCSKGSSRRSARDAAPSPGSRRPGQGSGHTRTRRFPMARPALRETPEPRPSQERDPLGGGARIEGEGESLGGLAAGLRAWPWRRSGLEPAVSLQECQRLHRDLAAPRQLGRRRVAREVHAPAAVVLLLGFEAVEFGLDQLRVEELADRPAR